LVDQIQKLAASHADQGLRAFVVFEGGPELKPAIEQVTRENKITIPLTYLPQGKASSSLREYKVNPEARNTIVTYRNKMVTANFVDVNPNSFTKVTEAAEAMLKS
jgi:hypothetical protein